MTTSIFNTTARLGIGDDGQWSVLERSGREEICEEDLFDLIPGNVQDDWQHTTIIALVARIRTGELGISVTVREDANPVTYAVLVDAQTIRGALDEPMLITSGMNSEFGVPVEILNRVLGQGKAPMIAEDLRAKLALRLFCFGLARRKPRYLSMPVGIFGLLNVLGCIRTRIEGTVSQGLVCTYPVFLSETGSCAMVWTRAGYRKAAIRPRSAGFVFANGENGLWIRPAKWFYWVTAIWG